MRTLRASTVLILAVFLLAGCMKLDAALTIESGSDTLRGSFIIAVNKHILRWNGQTAEEGWAETEPKFVGIPRGTRSEVYDDGITYGRKIIFEGYPLAEFNRQNPTASVTHQDGKYIFQADGTEPVTKSTHPDLVSELAKTEITIAVTFPGKVIEHDTQSTVRDRTVVWRLKLSDFKRIRAVSREQAPFPWLPLPLSVALPLAIAVGVFAVFTVLAAAAIAAPAIRKRRRPAITPPMAD